MPKQKEDWCVEEGEALALSLVLTLLLLLVLSLVLTLVLLLLLSLVLSFGEKTHIIRCILLNLCCLINTDS